MQLKHKEENLGVYVYGNKITYECRKKYKLIGNDTIRCQESGQWSNTLGKCVSKFSCLIYLEANSGNI